MKTQTTPAASRSASRRPARSSKPLTTEAQFEAPITVTFSGPLAAIVRFMAYFDELTPEEIAIRAITGHAVSELPAGFSMTDADAARLLGVAD